MTDKQWGYCGDIAPQHWKQLGVLDESRGGQQSPIDLPDQIPLHTEGLLVHYKPSHCGLINTGHTVEVYTRESNYIELDGERYDFVQLHFHAPSEHTRVGRQYAVECHFVHANAQRGSAVLAVLLEKGERSTFFDTFFANLPQEPGQEHSLEEVVDFEALLPTHQEFCRYTGSLTTPPCSEGVEWIIMRQPMQVKGASLAMFTRLYSGNSRPLQPLCNHMSDTFK